MNGPVMVNIYSDKIMRSCYSEIFTMQWSCDSTLYRKCGSGGLVMTNLNEKWLKCSITLQIVQ